MTEYEMSAEDVIGACEAMLFVTDEALSALSISEMLGIAPARVQAALDELRRRRVERKYRSDVARMAAELEEDDRFEMEVYERLYAAIDQLPKKTAEVLRLKLMGMSYEDIARRQDISPETVHSHLRHGIARLRGKISKDLLSLLFL